MKNRTPFLLCIISGIIFFLTQYSQGAPIYMVLYFVVHAIPSLSPVYLLIDIILVVLWFIAFFAGPSVIIGGYLLTTSHIRLGKIIITIAAGAGLITLIFWIAYAYITLGIAGLLILAALIVYSVSGLGILLTIIARYNAK